MTLFWIFLLIVAVWFVMRYVTVSVKRTSNIDAPAELDRPKPPLAMVSPDSVDEVEITGESHYQKAFARLFGSPSESGYNEHCAAELVRESDNKYDKNAVRCEIARELVGYVNRGETRKIAKWMDKRKMTRLAVNANVRGGWNRGADKGLFGVTVELDPQVLDA